ncbi:MAG: hypothetical protein WCI47_00135 [bacterium]
MTTFNFVNCTPHPITLFAANGSEVVFPRSGMIVRVEQTREHVIDLITDAGHPVQISQSFFGSVTGLPEPIPDTYLIVSNKVAQTLKAIGRASDILVVDDTVRDDEGHIIGCRGFARV